MSPLKPLFLLVSFRNYYFSCLRFDRPSLEVMRLLTKELKYYDLCLKDQYRYSKIFYTNYPLDHPHHRIKIIPLDIPLDTKSVRYTSSG